MHSQTGQAALITTIFVMAIALLMTFAVTATSLINITIARNALVASQSYYAAEAGAEDALLRLVKNWSWSSPYTVTVANSPATVTIAQNVGGLYTIQSRGSVQNRVRAVEIGFAKNREENISLFYGVQVGNGGMTMDNNSEVVGNVYANSTVSGSGSIGESITVASPDKIDGIDVGANATVHNCEDSDIVGTLTHVTGGTITRCDAGTTVDGGPTPIPEEEFPITPEHIATWQADAQSGGTLNGNVTIAQNTSMGPQKIAGNLVVSNNVILTMTGTIWVTGTFTPNNNVTVKLDEDVYGDDSGVFVVDDNVQVINNVTLMGTGASGSYLLVIGNSTSTNLSSPAMDVSNNVLGAILFTPNGLMRLHNNVDLTEATAYQLHLDNNASVTYDGGLANATFVSGPKGGLGVQSWREVE